jgi:putative nucleotidyltransferase with HDIG domain
MTPTEQLKQSINQKLKQLPVLPTAVVELLALDQNSEDYSDKLVALLELEPSMAARVLGVSNSAWYAPEQPIRSIPQAVARIGARRACQVVVSEALSRIFVPKSESEFNLWRHAVQTAVAAEEIAKVCGEVHPNEAYLLGLLHDIARFVLFEFLPERIQLTEEYSCQAPVEIIGLEREHCGVDHCEVGVRVCQALSLPPEMGLLIKVHHSGGQHELSKRQRALMHTVQQADRLSWLLLQERDIVSSSSDDRLRLLRQVCVAPEWDRPPASIDILDRLLSVVVKRSDDQMLSLGVGMIKRPRNR